MVSSDRQLIYFCFCCIPSNTLEDKRQKTKTIWPFEKDVLNNSSPGMRQLMITIFVERKKPRSEHTDVSKNTMRSKRENQNESYPAAQLFLVTVQRKPAVHWFTLSVNGYPG